MHLKKKKNQFQKLPVCYTGSINKTTRSWGCDIVFWNIKDMYIRSGSKTLLTFYVGENKRWSYSYGKDVLMCINTIKTMNIMPSIKISRMCFVFYYSFFLFLLWYGFVSLLWTYEFECPFGIVFLSLKLIV